MADQPSAVAALLRNRIIQGLAIIAAMIAILGEANVVFTNFQQSRIQLETARNAQLQQLSNAQNTEAANCKAQSDYILNYFPGSKINGALNEVAKKCASHLALNQPANSPPPPQQWSTTEVDQKLAQFRADTPQRLQKLEADLPAVIADEVKANGKAGKKTANQWGAISFNALCLGQFEKGLAAAEKAHALDPNNLQWEGNRALALTLLGRTDEANTIVASHSGQSVVDVLGLAEAWEQDLGQRLSTLKDNNISSGATVELAARLSKENNRRICADQRRKGKDHEFLKALGCI